MFSAGQCLHREPSPPPLRAALSHGTPSPWPPLLAGPSHPHTDTSRDTLINTSSLSLSFIIHFDSILQHEHEQEAHLIKLFISPHIYTSTNTSVSRIFVKFTLTLPAHLSSRAYLKQQNANSYLCEHLFHSHKLLSLTDVWLSGSVMTPALAPALAITDPF